MQIWIRRWGRRGRRLARRQRWAPFVGNTPMGLISEHDNRLGTSSDSYRNAT